MVTKMVTMGLGTFEGRLCYAPNQIPRGKGWIAWRVSLYSAGIILVCCAVTGHTQQASTTASGTIGYSEFMALSPQLRDQAWKQLSAESKALLKRTHAERWLSKHRQSLSDLQVSVVEETIAFVTPRLYLHPQDPESRKREQDLKRKLECIFGRRSAVEAFTFLPPPKRTLSDVLSDCFDCFTDCVAK
jgi:hypothetical protein